VLDQSSSHRIDVGTVWLIQPDDVHDREPTFTEGCRQLGHCGDRRTRAVNRHRSIVARDVQEIALHIDQHQCGRAR
jgi:hypothetical protein